MRSERHAHDALVGTRGQVEAVGSAFEQRPAFVIERAGRFERVAVQARIGDAGAFHLHPPRLRDPLRDVVAAGRHIVPRAQLR